MDYIKYDEFQQYLYDHFIKTQEKLSFGQAIHRMQKEGLYYSGDLPAVDASCCNPDNREDICRLINASCIALTTATLELEGPSTQPEPLMVFKYPCYSRAGVHIQDGIEFNYVYSGCCTLWFEDKSYTISENEVAIIPPNTRHDILDTEGSIVFSFLIHQDYFNDTFFQVISKDSPLSTFYDLCLYHEAKTFLKFHITQSQKFLHTFLMLFSEFVSDPDHNFEICINYVRILFAYLLKQPSWNFEHETQDSVFNMVNNLPSILNYIKTHYCNVTLNALAEKFHYERSYLGKLIKKYTRMSFSDLVTGYRLNHAVFLLLSTSRSIEEIAEETGYQSADHFYRMFRSRYGMSPSKYRKDRRAK